MDDVVNRNDVPATTTSDFSDTPLASSSRLLTDVLVSLNILVFVLQIAFANELHLTELGVNVHAFVDRGELWRLVSAMFLHGSFLRLLLNNVSLHALGSITEWTCGKSRFIVIYVLSGIGGNLASYAVTSGTSEDQIASLGASGAIFGLAGALIVYFARNQVLYRDKGVPSGMLMRLLLTVTGNFALGSLLPNIDEAGHWGGLVTGAVLALILGPSYQLVKLKHHKENEVYLVDDSVRGWTISTDVRSHAPTRSLAVRCARSFARSPADGRRESQTGVHYTDGGPDPEKEGRMSAVQGGKKGRAREGGADECRGGCPGSSSLYTIYHHFVTTE